jgi:hypothetical protein
MPFAFTEQGVASLSSVLTSDRAIDVNIAIMRTFVSMRRVHVAYSGMLQRMDSIELRLHHHEMQSMARFETVFEAMSSGGQNPTQGIFFDGKTVYHLGASLKDLGKKWFAFSKMDSSGLTVMERLGSV